jgi:hypothetical protein
LVCAQYNVPITEDWLPEVPEVTAADREKSQKSPFKTSDSTFLSHNMLSYLLLKVGKKTFNAQI